MYVYRVAFAISRITFAIARITYAIHRVTSAVVRIPICSGSMRKLRKYAYICYTPHLIYYALYLASYAPHLIFYASHLIWYAPHSKMRPAAYTMLNTVPHYAMHRLYICICAPRPHTMHPMPVRRGRTPTPAPTYPICPSHIPHMPAPACPAHHAPHNHTTTTASWFIVQLTNWTWF